MSRVCHSARVDSKFGSDTRGDPTDLDKPFKTINSAIAYIRLNKCSNKNNVWTIYISPCLYKEDIILYPFINLHGMDEVGTMICGTISTHLKQTSDEVEIEEFTLIGEINKTGSGQLNLAGIAIISYNTPINISEGQITGESCILTQLANENIPYTFYNIFGTAPLNVNIRDSRHERSVKLQITPSTVISNVLNTNSNNNTVISFQNNLFTNTFRQLFLGLLIPYENNPAAGLFQAHGDTLRHLFMNGAGNGAQIPVVGQTYTTAFMLTRKVVVPGATLEVHIHTVEVLNLPEVGFNVFSSGHTEASQKAKTKHIGFQGFREVPEALRILNGSNVITIMSPKAERSMTGTGSDNKLFASRLILEVLGIVDLPITPDLQGPSMIIPNNVGFVDVLQTPVTLLIPFGPNLTIGQQITFNLQVPGPVLISTPPDPENLPPPQASSVLTDNSLPGAWSSIVYDLLNLKPSPTIYPPATVGIRVGVASVTFTLTAISGGPSNPTYLWRGLGTPSQSTLLTPGSHTLTVPAQATTFYLTAWSGGGAGGRNGGPTGDGSDCCGGGGGAGAGLTLSQPVAGISFFNVYVGAGSRTAGESGLATVITFSESNGTEIEIIATAGGPGGNGPTPSLTASPAPGGSGGIIQYYVNQTQTPPPPNLIVYNGASGGTAGPVTQTINLSYGLPGNPSPTGYPGGAGGLLNQMSSNLIISGAGGGAGGFNGTGASAPSFYFNYITHGWIPIGSRSNAAPASGAGGAGEGPRSIAGVANGGDGGAIYYFV